MQARIVSIAMALLSLGVLQANVSPDFTPIRSELANARGFSRGILNLVVLPDGEPFRGMPAWSVLLYAVLFLFLFTVRLKPDTTYGSDTTHGSKTRVSTMLRFMALIAIGLLLAVLVSPYVSPFRLVLAPRTFALLVVLVCATRAFGAWSTIVSRWTPADAVRRRLGIAAAGAIGAAFFASAMFQTLAIYGGNYTGFLHIAREVAAQAPFLQERPDISGALIVDDAGYDGQFMYLMAFDPFLRRFADRPEVYRAFIDYPPYRYGRIGFSLLTSLVSAQRAERYPATMVWLILAAHAALAAALAALAVRHGMAPWVGLWYLAIPAFMSSLMSALPEALAAAGMITGWLCWEARRPVLAAVAFGAALLVRETGVVLIVAILLSTRWRGPQWKSAVLVCVLSLLPVSAWRLFVASRLFSEFGWLAIVPTPGDFGPPFAGLLHLWQAGVGGTQAGSEIAGAMVFPLILAAALVAAVALLVHPARADRDRRGRLRGHGGLPQLRKDLEPPAERGAGNLRAVSVSASAAAREPHAACLGPTDAHRIVRGAGGLYVFRSARRRDVARGVVVDPLIAVKKHCHESTKARTVSSQTGQPFQLQIETP